MTDAGWNSEYAMMTNWMRGRDDEGGITMALFIGHADADDVTVAHSGPVHLHSQMIKDAGIDVWDLSSDELRTQFRNLIDGDEDPPDWLRRIVNKE